MLGPGPFNWADDYGFGGEPPLPGWLGDDRKLCIRCHDFPAMRDADTCGHCHWAIAAEVDELIGQLNIMLRSPEACEYYRAA